MTPHRSDTPEAPLDMLAFAPHPDDAELYCAGTLLMSAREGGRVGIVDLTRGELSTRGTPERRVEETAEATRILGLAYRGNMDFPDGDISNTGDNRLALIREIRRLRPRVVLLPWHRDRHPDHEHASIVVREALFAAGLRRIVTMDEAGAAQEAFRPARAYYYMMSEDFTPAFIVDISEVFERKLAAIDAYGSQFYSGETVKDAEKGAETYISDPSFLPSLIGRARRLGFHVGGEYGEGFVPLQPLRLRAEWM
ncbi:MAG: bacillithiol biosynthesis deacetylase BshB1 [Bacteroidetes bacterium]|nr:bacillithiol biosynthesis deacetylase BshB1 [Bacteroidota bacterium]